MRRGPSTKSKSRPFFETAFWFTWAATFAFQPWHSAVEFKRCLHRFMLAFARTETLGGVKRTVWNQYESLVVPLQCWLEAQGVAMRTGCTVTDLAHRSTDGAFVVSALHCTHQGRHETIQVADEDLVFVQNGSMTDASSLGSMSRAPAALGKADSANWALWEKLAAAHAGFGNPAAFNRCLAQSAGASFTVTLKNRALFEQMQALSGNEAGTGGLLAFKDSNWLMSIVLAHQPHFAKQPPDGQVLWGQSLLPDRVGNFVGKPMADCNGADILQELCGHLRFDLDTVATAHCIPCRMPYLTSMLMPRAPGDRPLPVPAGSQRLAFISPFVEIPLDTVCTVEYSIRAAQMAVYQLLGIQRAVPPVTLHDQSVHAQIEALIKAMK
jgi:oleate hydratase